MASSRPANTSSSEPESGVCVCVRVCVHVSVHVCVSYSSHSETVGALTNSGHECLVQSEGEDWLSEMSEEVLHHPTYHVHITHLHATHTHTHTHHMVLTATSTQYSCMVYFSNSLTLSRVACPLTLRSRSFNSFLTFSDLWKRVEDNNVGQRKKIPLC